MNSIEKKLIDLGIIDSPILFFKIDDWFENVVIKFNGGDDATKITCHFRNCFTIKFEHDKTYSKGMNSNGNLDYQYFVQDVEIVEAEGFYECKISAWPFDGLLSCKNIDIEVEL